MQQFQYLDKGILILIGSLLITVLLSWFSLFLAPLINLMDDPKSADHKKHIKVIPLTGGLVFSTTLLILIILTGLWKDNNIWAIFVSGLFIASVGLLDDFIHLTPIQKFSGQLIGAIFLIFNGVQVNIFDSPDFFYSTDSNLDTILNISFTLLWLLALTNAFNFIDSIDGLVVGLSGVSTIFFFISTLITGQHQLFLLCAIVLGICVGLYFFNSHPAKLFLGDSGAQILGFILASIAIVYDPSRGFQSSTWFVPILIFYMPLFDLLLVIISRLKRKKRIYKAARDHTYHRLAQKGISIHHAVLIIHGVSLVMSMIGYLCLSLSVFNANFIFIFAVLLGLLAFIKLDKNYN